jgi:hypothetical protein
MAPTRRRGDVAVLTRPARRFPGFVRTRQGSAESHNGQGKQAYAFEPRPHCLTNQRRNTPTSDATAWFLLLWVAGRYPPARVYTPANLLRPRPFRGRDRAACHGTRGGGIDFLRATQSSHSGVFVCSVTSRFWVSTRASNAFERNYSSTCAEHLD